MALAFASEVLRIFRYATEAALDQLPSVFGDAKTTEGAYALAAYRMKGGSGPFGPRPG